jgi:CRISPR-associated protein (TIGR02584 family)
MTDSAEFPRRVPLAVSGLSPQVLTETIYALAVKRKPLFLPTEIHLVTTQERARRARLTLLSRSPG